MNTRKLYSMTNSALIAMFAMALLLVPSLSSTGTVSAQKGAREEKATPEMIWRALDLRSATNFAAFAENGISDNGNSLIKGDVGVARESAKIKGLNGGNVKGLVQGSNADTLKAQRDYADAFSATSQLPCTTVSGSDLGGRRFTPGVYCLASANLAGELTLDGGNDANAIFIFKVAGAFTTEKDSTISLLNKAQAPSVFFVADDTASIGEGSSLKGNVYARNSIAINDGATVEGRALSLKGDVSMSNGVLGPQEPGFVEICKAINTAGGTATGLENRTFRFRIGAITTEVPAGGCSGPISVTAGPITIEELLTGRNTLTGAEVNGNFILTGVAQISNTGQVLPNQTAITSVNLPLRLANVNVQMGTSSEQTIIQFTNQFAIIGIVEICKDALDSGVFGNFQFTIDGVTQGLGQPAPNVTFNVPTGLCSGPIAVAVPSNLNQVAPRTGSVTIREVARTGFIFTSASALPGSGGSVNRLQTFNVLPSGGGNATVTVVAGTDGGITDTGATAVQTTVFFNNRTAPGQLKICKVAGPGIAELTPFNFTVVGVTPFGPVGADIAFTQGNNPTPPNGIVPGAGNPAINTGMIRAGAVPQGGTVTTTTPVTVLAGPVNNPNGFCQIVPGTFVVDTPVIINEIGIAPNNSFVVPNIINGTGPTALPTGVSGVVRVSRITSNTGVNAGANVSTTAAAAGVSPNPLLGPTPTIAASLVNGVGVPVFPTTNGATTGVVVPIRRGVTEVEFVNIAFAPVPLKICKVAGTGVTVGTVFNFTVTADTFGGLLAPFTSATIPVQAGPAPVLPGDPNGFCEFVPGPFSSPTIGNLSTFNFNSQVTITEAAGNGTTVVAPNGITSPTSGASIITNIAGRAATISNLINGTNEIRFVNQAAGTPVPVKSRKRVRFL